MIVRFLKRSESAKNYFYKTAKKLNYDLPMSPFDEMIDKKKAPSKIRIAEVIENNISVDYYGDFYPIVFAFKGKVDIETMKQAYFAYKTGFLAGFTASEYLAEAIAYTHEKNNYILAGISNRHLPSGKIINLYYYRVDIRRCIALNNYISAKLNLETPKPISNNIDLLEQELYDTLKYRVKIIKEKWLKEKNKINKEDNVNKGDYLYLDLPSAEETLKFINHILNNKNTYVLDYEFL